MKLTLELVPSTASGQTLYEFLTKKAWNTLREKVFEEYNFRCGICGATTGQLNCHEQWTYDDENTTQKLVRLISLCQMCHLVKHMNQRGASLDVLAEHFMRVNGCSRQEFEVYYQQCLEEQKRRVGGSSREPVRIWWPDWGEYTSLLAQEGNLKRRYQWRNGNIVALIK